MGSCISLILIALAGQSPEIAPLVPLVFGLGFFNGMFAVAAIGSMMSLASQNNDKREGTRMGLWGQPKLLLLVSGPVRHCLVDLLRLINFSQADAYGRIHFRGSFIRVGSNHSNRSITNAFSGTTQMVGE